MLDISRTAPGPSPNVKTEAAKAVKPTSRLDQIDAWRGLGVSLVILFHCRGWIEGWGPGYDLYAPKWINLLPAKLSYWGLTLFFTASGFLITTTLLKRFGSLGKLSAPGFYIVRFARIGPFLLLLLAVLSTLHLLHVKSFIINEFGRTTGSLPSALLSVLTFRFNSYVATHGVMPLPWTVLWTLSVEEMFYLFYPVVCILTYRVARGPWLLICVLCAFLVMGQYSLTEWTSPQMHVQAYLSCMDAISAGCLTAMLVDSVVRRGIIVPKYLLLAMEIASNLVVLWILANPFSHMDFRASFYRRTLIVAMCGIAFTAALTGRPGGILAAPFRFFGKYIYEAYLTHAIVISAVFWTYAALSWACATFYSEPLNRRLRKILLRRPPAKAVPIDVVSVGLVRS